LAALHRFTIVAIVRMRAAPAAQPVTARQTSRQCRRSLPFAVGQRSARHAAMRALHEVAHAGAASVDRIGSKTSDPNSTSASVVRIPWSRQVISSFHPRRSQ